MASLFNSLGSNYTAQLTTVAWRSMWSKPIAAVEKLATQLARAWETEQLVLTYKGRDAIELALRSVMIGKGDVVLTQAFSCHAIEEAITRVGAQPAYVDLDPQTWNLSVDTLAAAYRQLPKRTVKAVLVQHTLGMPADIKRIRSWCNEQQLVLIEDLAQAYGGTSLQGKPLGSYADVIVLSFGRDKILDGVTGGAVLWQPDKLEAFSLPQLPAPPAAAVKKDARYPVLTSWIRGTHDIILGKILFRLAKRWGWLTSPVASPTRRASAVPAFAAALVVEQLQLLPKQLKHRLKIAQAYHRHLSSLLQHHDGSAVRLLVDESTLEHASNLRYNVWVADPSAAISALQKHHIYVADRWYRQPVDSGSLRRPTQYQAGSCPVAEDLAGHILNLPTHWSVTPSLTERIAQIIITSQGLRN